MTKFLVLTIICLATCACVSPYQGQANALNQAYQRGQISTSDYHARMNELQALDLQYRQATDQAMQQSFQNMANQPRSRAVMVPALTLTDTPESIPKSY